MDVLKINYPEGCMEIRVDGFFPCSQEKLKKLIRLMKWTDKDEIKDLVDTLQEMYDDCALFREASAKLFHEYHQKMVEHQQMISEGKHPNGIPLTKAELAEMKYQVRVNKEWKKDQHKKFTMYHNRQQKLLKNIETLVKLL